jgi:Na+-transporting NADH:ubiquinone oxidoreductase subunit NqrC
VKRTLPPKLSSEALGDRHRRSGASTILVLTVMLLVGLFIQQSVRSMWLLRRGQDQSQQIAQARELLELAKILDARASRESAEQLQLLKQQPIIVPVLIHFGRLEWIDNTPSDGNSGSDNDRSSGRWVAKLPVDAQGVEVPGLPVISVSSEESAR